MNVNQDGERARERLAHARRRSDQLGKELRNAPQADDPDPDWLRLNWAYSESNREVLEAEHAVGKAEDGTPGITGTRGQYRWLSSVDHDIDALLRLCPEVLLGRRIAVTSIDCLGLRLTEEETRAGWRKADDRKVYKDLPSGGREYQDGWVVACSPVLHSVHGLSYETHEEYYGGFDEWYVFDGEIPVSDFEVFVNWGFFRLYDTEGYGEFIDRFWTQMTDLNAESYIAQGDVFTFATRNLDVFDGVIAAFSAELRRSGASGR